MTNRPPAVPLVCHDPYFSIWSFGDRLTDSWLRHWTGTFLGAAGLARIDGRTVRFCGCDRFAEPMEQVGLEVLPTRTIYRFAHGGVELVLTFTTPALPDDLDILSRPVTYITFDVRCTDGRSHEVSLYFDIQADWAADTTGQQVEWGRHRLEGLSLMRAGTVDQRVLGRSGDNLRIDWGYIYHVVPAQDGAADATGCSQTLRRAFAATGRLPVDDDIRMPRPVADQWPVLAAAFELGKVSPRRPRGRWVMAAYDDLFAVEYLRRRLPAYWRRDGQGFADMLKAAASQYASLRRRCEAFDKHLMADLRRSGGDGYARLCALAYRQALAAHKLVADVDGTPLHFSKENFSNGCIGTVDVTYPGAPLFLLLAPALLKAQLRPVLDYALTPRWKFPFAPHDLGTYPLANGQVYGGGERGQENQMPVEECGNMLLLVAALARADGDLEFPRRYWPLLRKWAAYLQAQGLDPHTQLCTDDFAGHLGHNANLSLKAICALGAFAQLAAKLGEKADAARFAKAAKGMASRWERMADDGDHYRLAFDRPGTWSQKYNLIWDRLLGLGLFGKTVSRREVDYYKTRQQRYGLPLDSRKTYTKLDWLVWTACLTGRRDDFDALTAPIYDWLDSTPSRVPLTDWYETTDGRQVGFQARSVVGGLFMKLLADRWLAR